MKYRKLGTTGLDVSPIGIGAMQYGDPQRGHPVWSLDEDNSRPLIKHALDVGINLFDTANLYSNGSSEEILGRALADFADRDEIVIATKLRHPVGTGPNKRGLSRKHILQEVEHQLSRLRTDYIDLLQIHRNDPATPRAGVSQERCTCVIRQLDRFLESVVELPDLEWSDVVDRAVRTLAVEPRRQMRSRHRRGRRHARVLSCE
ncbi:MAG TPA: hypothetical protein DEA69_06365 [Microbacterium sp.]|uniref:aldo/keto reductase n=1 Tax=unclassified Microbacterium TaxID=2609290 RepID=UPI000C421D71|nr:MULTISPECIES: aldo/keto reductase [unclassified Microbacterium]MBU19051.1 hypothetical protein [Microbacterium sp.]HBS08406.1 hypothetical protein [Microbacterium sp.]HBU42810.1 hypothetical protein [Microbacterium sp.]|tara:strand:- start:1720 stop:2331 length:612 start_codon:yes stop_codon:yes gene_type:complete